MTDRAKTKGGGDSQRLSEQSVRPFCVNAQPEWGQIQSISPFARNPVIVDHRSVTLEPGTSQDAVRQTFPWKLNSGGGRTPIDWDMAYREFIGRFKEIQWRDGKQAFAIACPGRLTLEESFLLSTLAEQGMETAPCRIESAASSSLLAYEKAFGSPVPPYSLADLEESDTIVILGDDVTSVCPPFLERLQRNPYSPDVIAISSGTTTRLISQTHQITVAPDTEALLLQAILRVMIEKDGIDHDFISRATLGFETLADSLRNCDLIRASRMTGVPIGQIEELAERLSERQRVSFWWAADGSEHRHHLEKDAINLALATGHFGRPGTGANALLPFDQLLEMRASEMLTRGHPGHEGPHQHVPLDWSEIREKILSEEIKGLWIIASNASADWQKDLPASNVLSRLDFLVVQGQDDSPSLQANVDLYFPSKIWEEKAGSILARDRRLFSLAELQSAPEQVRNDFDIFRQLALYWGCRDLMAGQESPEAVFRILRERSQTSPLDFTGVESLSALAHHGDVQLPFDQHCIAPHGDRRLYDDLKFATSSGKAHFLCDALE